RRARLLRERFAGSGPDRRGEHEPSARESRELDETAAAQRGRVAPALHFEALQEFGQIRIGRVAHEAPPGFAIFAAALWFALRIRVYVPQGQMFAAMSLSICSSVGFGTRASSAVARMICPAWQYPHCGTSSSIHACCTAVSGSP